MSHCVSLLLLPINRWILLHGLQWRHEGWCFLTPLTKEEVSRLDVGERGSWGVNGWESLETKFGHRDWGWAKTLMNQRDSLMGQEEDILRGSDKQTISKIQFPLLKKPLPNSNFSDQRDSHYFDLCATILPLLLFLMGPTGLWGQQAWPLITLLKHVQKGASDDRQQEEWSIE